MVACIAARPRRCGRPDRGLTADDIHLASRRRDARSGGGRGRMRLCRWRAAGPPPRPRRAHGRLADRGTRDRLPARARAGAARRATQLLLLPGPGGFGLPHGRRRLPDAPRNALRAPRPVQLLRAGHQRLLQHRLPLRRRHAARRKRVPYGLARDLGVSAVQRVCTRACGRPGVAARAPDGTSSRLGRAGRRQRHGAGARLRL